MKARRSQAQKEAAEIFGAEQTYFVLNGTSASNKIVLSALIADGDLVLFDRNNHKAAHHGALLIGGGIPIYLPTERNAYGLIGPIEPAALDETAIREAIRGQSAGQGCGRLETRAAVPRRRHRAMHL